MKTIQVRLPIHHGPNTETENLLQRTQDPVYLSDESLDWEETDSSKRDMPRTDSILSFPKKNESGLKGNRTNHMLFTVKSHPPK